jgi:hypothetical protein
MNWFLLKNETPIIIKYKKATTKTFIEKKICNRPDVSNDAIPFKTRDFLKSSNLEKSPSIKLYKIINSDMKIKEITTKAILRDIEATLISFKVTESFLNEIKSPRNNAIVIMNTSVYVTKSIGL